MHYVLGVDNKYGKQWQTSPRENIIRPRPNTKRRWNKPGDGQTASPTHLIELELWRRQTVGFTGNRRFGSFNGVQCQNIISDAGRNYKRRNIQSVTQLFCNFFAFVGRTAQIIRAPEQQWILNRELSRSRQGSKAPRSNAPSGQTPLHIIDRGNMNEWMNEWINK